MSDLGRGGRETFLGIGAMRRRRGRRRHREEEMINKKNANLRGRARRNAAATRAELNCLFSLLQNFLFPVASL